MSQVAYQVTHISGLCSLKQLGVYLLPTRWDASPSQGYPPALIWQYPFIHLGGEGMVRVNCLA